MVQQFLTSKIETVLVTATGSRHPLYATARGEDDVTPWLPRARLRVKSWSGFRPRVGRTGGHLPPVAQTVHLLSLRPRAPE